MMEPTQTIKPNAILEPKTRNGKRRLEVDGTEFTIFKTVKIYKDVLVGLESIATKSTMLINADWDKDYIVRFQ